MLLIAQNSEEAFLKDVKATAVESPTYRCLHIRVSQMGIERDIWFSFLTRLVSELIEENPPRVYICADGDAFVIARTLTQRHTQIFLSYLSRFLPALTNLPPVPLESAAFLFEVGVSIAELETITRTKISLIKAPINKPAKSIKDIGHKIDELQEISQNLMTTIATRREQRKEIEIMIVDDDMFSQRLVSAAVQGKYKIHTAPDGRGALMGYAKHAPDVLLLDIGLPDMDGMDVLARIFDIDPSAYVVMFSGNGSRENILKAVELGAKGFIGKPFTKDKLIKYLHTSPFVISKTERTQHEKNGASL